MASLPIEVQREAVATLFLSYLGRAPEFDAMEHYTKLLASLLEAQGDSTTAVDDAFKALSTQIYADAVGAGEVPPVGQHFTYEEYVAWIYTNVLGRAPDAEGLAYWTHELAGGHIVPAELVAIMVDAALGNERDALYLIHRTEVAVAYSRWEISSPEQHNAHPELSRTILQFVTEDPATKAAALAELDDIANIGETYLLSTGVDTISGTPANDIIEALYVPGSTLTPFDAIDGGAGRDTLNIHTDGMANRAFPQDATVKNVEVVNIHNGSAIAVDTSLTNAANYAGVTELWQFGAVASSVSNLQAGTVAGFRHTEAAQPLMVLAAEAAPSVQVALDQVSDQTTLTVGGQALTALDLTGTVRSAAREPVQDLALTVHAAADATELTLATEINVRLALTGAQLATLDAAGSTGKVIFGMANDAVAPAALAEHDAPSLHTILTGSGDDRVTTTFQTSRQQGATIVTGAGDDDIYVLTSGTGLTSVDAGDGSDLIWVEPVQGNRLDIQAGAGDDIVAVLGMLQATDKIDGGEGQDAIIFRVSDPLVADHYVVFNKVVTNFEHLHLRSDPTADLISLDAAQLAANYTEIGLFDYAGGAAVVQVGGQALVTDGNLRAEAAGTTFTDAAKTQTAALAGELQITLENSGVDYTSIYAYAETVNLTAQAAGDDVYVWLGGNAEHVNVTLERKLNEAEDAYSGDVEFWLESHHLPSLSTVTVAGDGWAWVDNYEGSVLAMTDATGMAAGLHIDGKTPSGLFYWSTNTRAETVKLGAGKDLVELSASTYAAMDTVENLVLVAGADGLDQAASDIIRLWTVLDAEAEDYLQITGFKTFTTAQTDLDLALKEAAASADDALVFHLGENTYIYHDLDLDGANLLDAGDTVIKLVGTLDLDLLVASLDSVADIV